MLQNIQQWFMRHFGSICFTFIIWVLCFYPFSAMPQALPPFSIPYLDKWVHMALYLILSVIIWWEEVRYRCVISLKSISIKAFLLPVLMGGLIEILQGMTTYRGAEWADFGADTIGVIIGNFIGFYFLRPLFSKS